MHRFGEVRSGLLAAVAIGAMITASPVQAQAQPRQDYSLEMQDLADALRAVSRQSGQEIMFSEQAVSGKRAPRLHGPYTAEEAVRALIAGTDLVADFTAGGILIRGRSEAPNEVVNRSAVEADIVVTGTHIRGNDSASPVLVTTRKQIEASGQTDLGGFIRTLPQNYSGGQNPTVAGGGNQGTLNQNTTSGSSLNLRGLGPDATLTLVNGHRLAYDGVGQGVDISAIPLIAIDRVEIVPDGSSALYGSDAVGGVANVILRRDYDGLATTVRFGGSTQGGNAQQQYSAIAGQKWSSGGLMVAGDYARTTAIQASDRSYSQDLDSSQTLVPRQRQFSAVVVGHQHVADGVEFVADAELSNRRSALAFPFLTTTSVFENGLYADPDVTNFAVSGRLEIELPHHWRGTVAATYGRSKSDILSRFFQDGTEYQRSYILYDNDAKLAEVGAEGPLFSLPGGDARLAIGGGYRSNGLSLRITNEASDITQKTDSFSSARNVGFGYAELSLPVIGSATNVPLVSALTFTGAVRYERYHAGSDIFTPKLGVIYSPASWLNFKASWGKSFKAQTLDQEFQLREVSLIDGALLNGFPQGKTFLYLSGGGVNLKPERATSWTTAIEILPPATGLSLVLSYFGISFQDRVVEPLDGLIDALNDPTSRDLVIADPTLDQVNATIATASQGLRNLTGAPFDASQVGAIINNRFQNAARQSAHGVDLQLGYDSQLGSAGTINLSAGVSYLESEQQLTPLKPVVTLAGTIFDPPHWRARGGATFQSDRINLSAFASYIGGVEDNRAAPFYGVGSFTSIDILARMKVPARARFLQGLELTLSATNVFDTKPSVIRNSLPTDPTYDSTNYPVAGRVLSVSLSKAW